MLEVSIATIHPLTARSLKNLNPQLNNRNYLMRGQQNLRFGVEFPKILAVILMNQIHEVL